MKKLLATILMSCPAILWGQASRVDINLLTSGAVAPGTGGLSQTLWVSNSVAYLCNHPSITLSACQSSLITTYTDYTGVTPCPPATPLVQPLSNVCTASTGVASNLGAWVKIIPFDYWIVSSYGTYGPYSYSPGSGGGGSGGTPGGSPSDVQVNVSGTFGGYPTLTYTPLQGLTVGATPVGAKVTAGPLSTVPTSWTFDWTTPTTALNSIGGTPLNGTGTYGNWPINAATATTAATATKAIYLSSPPTLCPAGQAPTGVNSYGNAVGCTAYSLAPTARTCNVNGCYRIDVDGTVTEWITGSVCTTRCTQTLILPYTLPSTCLNWQTTNTSSSDPTTMPAHNWTVVSCTINQITMNLNIRGDEGTFNDYPTIQVTGW